MKPMLACSSIPTLDQIKYPVIASPKLDGIRCLIIEGVAVSRNLKPIPNRHIQSILAKEELNGLDGELCLLSGDFNNVQSAVMSFDGKPDFVYRVFDYFGKVGGFAQVAYKHRIFKLGSMVRELNMDVVQVVPTVLCNEAKALELNYTYWLEEGYEGAIVRDPDGPYKFGRSTMNQGWMLKLKNFSDDEATIVGVEELMHNGNDQTLNEVGSNVRSRHQEGMYGGDTLGSLVCEYRGKQFNLGTGYTSAQRSELWAMRKNLPGKLVTFKFQELSKYGVPRFPVYKGLRNIGDTSC